MAIHLINLRGVPEDELDEIRALLNERDIAFHETHPGLFGLSAGGIWIHDDSRAEEARSLLADYQQQRQARARQAYEAQRQAGMASTFWSSLKANPLRFLAALAAAALVIYLSVMPFLRLN